MNFVPGLELSRALYEEQVAPLMAARFPGLPYAAATYGMCSETIGLDDPVSMDHQWGPRVTVLFSDQDRARYAQAVMTAFRKSFPAQFGQLRLSGDGDTFRPPDSGQGSRWFTYLKANIYVTLERSLR